MLNIKEIAIGSEGKEIKLEKGNVEYYSINSSDIQDKTWFIPLKGEKTDGHKYIIDAVKKGAIGFFINDECENKKEIIDEAIDINSKITIIEVKNTLESLKNIDK